MSRWKRPSLQAQDRKQSLSFSEEKTFPPKLMLLHGRDAEDEEVLEDILSCVVLFYW
jgi:hypothetical protein